MVLHLVLTKRHFEATTVFVTTIDFTYMCDVKNDVSVI